MKITDTTDKELPVKDRVITQALSRFSNAININRENNLEAVEDLRMLASKDHWPAKVAADRKLEGRPTLVINKLPGFAARVKNESRINQVSIKIVPRGGGATKETAELLNGLIRSIDIESDSDVAYQTALDGSVNCGFGFFRVITAYTEETAWDQEILVERIRNNFSVVLDPAINKHDGSDGRYAFVTEMIEEEEYKARWPNASVPSSLEDDGANANSSRWINGGRFRVGEYWVKVPKKKRLYLLSDGRTVDGDEWDEVVPLLQLTPDSPSDTVPQTPAQPQIPTIIKTRMVDSYIIEQYVIDGEKILEGPNEWPGRYIPIIPVWGEEVVVDDEVYRRGVVRLAKDPQRMYNYFRTAATETVALAPKAPWVGTAEQFENYEDDWDSANQSNISRLTYNHQPGVPPPQRQIVTQTAIGEITEANIASDEMKDTTSIQDASMGMASNEVSGIAIARRQSQSNIVNFTYADNLRLAIKFCGKIILDLIPKIYDTDRIIAIIKPDGDEDLVRINQEVVDPVSGDTTIINDLTLGRYGVTVTTGPTFQTQRQEAAASMMDFVRTAPETAGFVMDLIAEAQDWPNSTKIADRLKKMLPPGIDDDAPAPAPQPSIDDVIKDLKAKSMTLNIEKKKLDIVDKRNEMTDEGKNYDRIIEVLKKAKEAGIEY